MGTLTDIYKTYGLDKNNLYIYCFADSARNAVQKLDMLNTTSRSPALAFNEFTSAWLDYSIMPEDLQNRCERLVKPFRKLWKIVATAKVDDFHLMLTSASQGLDTTSYDDICVSCVEMINAVSFSKDIPNVTQLLSDAMNLIQNVKNSVSNTCKALLCVLCSKILEKLLCNITCKMSLLLEAVRYHMKSKSYFDCDVSSTELYMNIVADAICDLSIMNMEDDTIGNDFPVIIQEGYALLSVLETPIREHYEEILDSTSGISKSEARDIRWRLLSMEMQNDYLS